jgi:hypothetical protein
MEVPPDRRLFWLIIGQRYNQLKLKKLGEQDLAFPFNKITEVRGNFEPNTVLLIFLLTKCESLPLASGRLLVILIITINHKIHCFSLSKDATDPFPSSYKN